MWGLLLQYPELSEARITVSLGSQELFEFCSAFEPIFRMESSILVSPKSFDPQFWKLTPCPKQFLLPAGSPWFTSPLKLTLNLGLVDGQFVYQFQEHIHIQSQKASWFENFVKGSYFIFLKHVHLTISHLYGFANLIHYACSNCASILVSVFKVDSIHCVGTNRTQHEQKFVVTLILKHWMLQFLGGRSLHFIISSLSKHSGGESTPT